MRLELRAELAKGYGNRSQQARVLTESWVAENLYCLACQSDRLLPTPRGERVTDFSCPDCGEEYQLKSKSHKFGNQVANSAYLPKVETIRRRANPSYLFLQYNNQMMKVVNLFAIPKYFMFESAIKRRKPLGAGARRHGWVGSVILLNRLPLDSRIYVVRDGFEVPRNVVRSLWTKFSFLVTQPIRSRGWISDVMQCIRELDKKEFTLSELYGLEERLADLHPENRNVRPKIRQQLQVLRDQGIIEFMGGGLYRVLLPGSPRDM
jgi:type II restriction enzyme